jgi:hypothetical protein
MSSLRPRLRTVTRAVGFAAAVLLLGVSPALGYVGDKFDPTPGDRTWPLNAVLTYSWLPGHEPPDWMKPIIRREVAHLNDGSQQAQLPIFRYTTDPSIAKLKFGYGIPSDPTATVCGGVRTIICVTRDPSTDPHDALVLFAADTLDGSPYPWQKWCEFHGTPPEHWRDRCFEVGHITLRAMGFVYGLHRWDGNTFGHFGPGARITVMSAWALRKGVAGYTRHDFGVCDVARLQLLYDVHDDASRYSTCLDRQATQLALQASDQSIGFHDPVTFRAKLGLNVTEPDVFVGNVLSGRRVVLQRSTDDFVTFDSRAMHADPHGQYSLTFRPEFSAKYRAVFDTPEHEGLQGATSNVVEVFVAPPPP